MRTFYLSQPNTLPKASPYKPTRSTALKFASVYPQFMDKTLEPQYMDAFHKDSLLPDHQREHLLAPSITHLFREQMVLVPLVNLVKDGKPTRFVYLGMSDASEPLSGAIQIAAEKIPDFKKREQIQIVGIDYHAFWVELAKTWHIVIDQFEKLLQNRARTPLADENFNTYFKHKENDAPPHNFDELKESSPDRRLAQYTRDPVAGTSIGNGKGWYKVNHKKLPKISYEHAKLEDYVTQPPSSHQRQIYILSNSWAYLLIDDHSNAARLAAETSREKKAKFLQVIREIKEKNAGKEVWIAIGSMEREIFDDQPELEAECKQLGMKPVRLGELKRELGFQNIIDEARSFGWTRE